jgi:hypothetical protein
VGFELSLPANAPGTLKNTVMAASEGEARFLADSFSAPGLYTVYATEVQSPQGSAFDPSNFSIVSPAASGVIHIRVLPDRLVVTEQPPLVVIAGTPIEFSAALEDDQGNILTDLTGQISTSSGDTAPGMIVTATEGAGTENVLGDLPPVLFVNGVATMSNIVITTPDLYRLKATEVEVDLETGTILNQGSVRLTAKSVVFRVKPTTST